MTVRTPRLSASHTQAIRQARSAANWSPVEELYRQVLSAISMAEIAMAESGNANFTVPDVLVGALAVRLGRVCANYAARENQFISDAAAIIGQFLDESPERELGFSDSYSDRRFERLADYLGGLHRRRPTPFESAVETARRLRDLSEIRNAFQRSRISTGAILGGSLSYGRFFNVRGGDRTRQSSDIDLLLIVPEARLVERVPGILRRLRFIGSRDLELMANRISRFEDAERDSEHPMIFSQKIDVWESRHDEIYPDDKYWGQYGISFHITSKEGFERIIAADRPELKDDEKSIIFDFRTNTPADGIARGFDGIEDRFEHTVMEVGSDTVARFRVYDTLDGRYKPGLHQQLVLPNFEGRWSGEMFDIALPLLAFKWKLLERLRLERQRAPYRVQTLSLAHVRYQTFAPHVRRRTDALELES